ncbi:MAG TPA: hypothetical protein VHT94_09815 [Streptosporangiaceae bacterium]|jgi:hypothetical protein|nr:hypothetical protein [Streptosporangiaceae bacterium]
MAGATGVIAAVAAVSAVAAVTGLTAAPAMAKTTTVKSVTASASDRPPGFWYGTDSSTISIGGSVPYREPVIGGSYGGYIGMTGNWARWQCGNHILVWSSANASQATADFRAHAGVGTGAYWFMAGPGVDPHYNGTTGEAYAWGRQQAQRALIDAAGDHLNYPVIFMDVEIPGNAPNYTPAPDNGWNTVYTSACSGRVKSNGIAATVDRSVLNGFAAWVTGHSSHKVGVYSAPDIWASIFGTGSPSSLTNTYEWTYESFTSSLANPPDGWCLTGGASSTCARFFGGITGSSKYALMWQFSGGGGSSNGVGDFDQIDGTRTP